MHGKETAPSPTEQRIHGASRPSWNRLIKAIQKCKGDFGKSPEKNPLVFWWDKLVNVAAGIHSENAETMAELVNLKIEKYEPSSTFNQNLTLLFDGQEQESSLPLEFFAEAGFLDQNALYRQSAEAIADSFRFAFWKTILYHDRHNLTHVVLPNFSEPQYIFFLSNESAQKLLEDKDFFAWVLSGPIILVTEEAFKNFHDWQIMVDNANHEFVSHVLFQQRHVNSSTIFSMLCSPRQAIETDYGANRNLSTTSVDLSEPSAGAYGSMLEVAEANHPRLIEILQKPNQFPSAEDLEKSPFDFAKYFLYHVLYDSYAAWKIRRRASESLDFVVSPDSYSLKTASLAFHDLMEKTNGDFLKWRATDWREFCQWWEKRGKVQTYYLALFFLHRDNLVRVCDGDPEKIKQKLGWHEDNRDNEDKLQELLTAYEEIVKSWYFKYFKKDAQEFWSFVHQQLFLARATIHSNEKTELIANRHASEHIALLREKMSTAKRLTYGADFDWQDIRDTLASPTPELEARFKELIEERIIKIK